MLIADDRGIARRLTVFGYDVASPKRAYRVRQRLGAWRIDGQYSVVETYLTPRERIELAGILHEAMNSDEDRLLLATPASGTRLSWRDGNLVADSSASDGVGRGGATIASRCGHYLFTYDVRAPKRLQTLQERIAADTVALQRSVYWFRGGYAEAEGLAGDAAAIADLTTDRLWVYPLSNPRELWFIVGGMPPVLPVGRGDWHAPYRLPREDECPE